MYSKSPEQEIAADQLERLRENPDRCAWLSVHAGRHPWVRWNDDIGVYEIVETGGTGRLEVEGVEKDALINLFAENPVDIKPLSAATFSPPEPGRKNVWEVVENGGENVIYANECVIRKASSTGGGDGE